jgi:hypothetical protein
MVTRVEEIGDAGQVVERGEADAGPDEGDEPGEDEGDDIERVHDCRLQVAGYGLQGAIDRFGTPGSG